MRWVNVSKRDGPNDLQNERNKRRVGTYIIIINDWNVVLIPYHPLPWREREEKNASELTLHAIRKRTQKPNYQIVYILFCEPRNSILFGLRMLCLRVCERVILCSFCVLVAPFLHVSITAIDPCARIIIIGIDANKRPVNTRFFFFWYLQRKRIEDEKKNANTRIQ